MALALALALWRRMVGMCTPDVGLIFKVELIDDEGGLAEGPSRYAGAEAGGKGRDEYERQPVRVYHMSAAHPDGGGRKISRSMRGDNMGSVMVGSQDASSHKRSWQ